MRVPIFHADVTADGERLEFDQRERVFRRNFLRSIAGQRVDVIVRIHREKRSDKQNGWYRGVALPILADDLGYDRHEIDDLNHHLLVLCFGTHTDRHSGGEVPNVRSSSELNTKKFSEFMEWLVRWAATERGCDIPLPGESAAG